MHRNTFVRLSVVLFFAALVCACSDKHVIDDPSSSALPRPALERPPTGGLPADLRPPR